MPDKSIPPPKRDAANNESIQDYGKRVRAWQAEKEGKVVPPEPTETQADYPEEDLLPELHDRSETDTELDLIIDGIGIIEAYNRWCGKSQPSPGRSREGIKVSCPKPDHPDKNPSAWLNLDKNLWRCGACEVGGDVLSIAALHFGFDDITGANFHRLRETMAEDLGYTIKNVAGGNQIIYKDEPDVSPADESDKLHTAGLIGHSSSSPSSVPEPLATVTQLHPEQDDDYDEQEEDQTAIQADVPWRDIVPANTFLSEWMEELSKDDNPESYHFWHGLIALGHAAGRKVYIDDDPPLYGNLLLCLLGGTGSGKSRSRRWLNDTIREVMPFHDTGLDCSGVKNVSVPASGEYLVKEFEFISRDPSNPKFPIGQKSVNGIVTITELARLVQTGNRQGNTILPNLMEFADCESKITTGSLTRGSTVAFEPFCSVITSTQPRAIRKLISRDDAGTGFLNRWVFASGKMKPRQMLGGSHSSFQIDLSTAQKKLGEVYAWAGIERQLRSDGAANIEMQHFWDTLVMPKVDADETDLLKRLDILFKKVILLLSVNQKSPTITLEAVLGAEKMFRYILDSYALLNHNISMTLQTEIGLDVLHVIEGFQRREKKGATPTDILKYTNNKYQMNDLKHTLDTMSALDIIEIEPRKTGPGRKTTRWRKVQNE